MLSQVMNKCGFSIGGWIGFCEMGPDGTRMYTSACTSGQRLVVRGDLVRLVHRVREERTLYLGGVVVCARTHSDT